ncbi:kinesin family member 4/7/21/27 [Vigna unguiculata]|uniref:Kinesin family member 4/7/21/27 n=1 Tax=Vigna unguiculata TaxID=3917 RepID=A0A4D6LGN2_VIGUN|nr:kinesin family member 4/7/21/27 [Vigna unguiculata]
MYNLVGFSDACTCGGFSLITPELLTPELSVTMSQFPTHKRTAIEPKQIEEERLGVLVADSGEGYPMEHGVFGDLRVSAMARHCREVKMPLRTWSMGFGCKASLFTDDMEDHAKEIEHSLLKEKLDRELKELDKKLELNEAEMKMLNNAHTLVFKHHYEKKVLEYRVANFEVIIGIGIVLCNNHLAAVQQPSFLAPVWIYA